MNIKEENQRRSCSLSFWFSTAIYGHILGILAVTRYRTDIWRPILGGKRPLTNRRRPYRVLLPVTALYLSIPLNLPASLIFLLPMCVRFFHKGQEASSGWHTRSFISPLYTSFLVLCSMSFFQRVDHSLLRSRSIRTPEHR